MTSPSAAPSSAPWWRDLVWLLAGFGLLFCFQLGSRPLANPDEGRYAQIPAEMIARADGVTPTLNDVPYFEKPPLVYWTIAGAIVAFGKAEWAVRLPPVLFALAGILGTYAAARALSGRVAGLASAVVLGSSLLYFALSQIILLDMAVAVLIAGTLFCFILGVQAPPGRTRRWLFWGLYACAALATLAKGLIGFLLPGAVMFLWLLIFNQWRRLRPLHLPSGVLLFLLIAAPWHLLAAQRNPGWADFYFVHEHWERFTSSGHNRVQPWWFFIPCILAGIFPWTGFLFPAVREAVRGGWARRHERATGWFFVVWVAFIFLFFSKSQSKLIPYILPVFPALAVLIGQWLARRWEEPGRPHLRSGALVFSGVSALLAGAIMIVVSRTGVIRDPDQLIALRPFGWALAAVLVSGALLAGFAARLRRVRIAFAVIVGTMVVFCGVVGLAGGSLQRPSTRDLAGVVRAQAGAQDQVFHYAGFFHDFVYYSGRFVGLVDYKDELQVQFLSPEVRARRFITAADLVRQWSGPGRIWVVLRRSDEHHLRAAFPAGLTYHLLAESRSHYLVSNQR